MRQPTFSIVVPTKEGIPEYWLEALWKINGDLELILVNPPGIKKFSISGPRVQEINSLFCGEIIQRMTNLINASKK